MLSLNDMISISFQQSTRIAESMSCSDNEESDIEFVLQQDMVQPK